MSSGAACQLTTRSGERGGMQRLVDVGRQDAHAVRAATACRALFRSREHNMGADG